MCGRAVSPLRLAVGALQGSRCICHSASLESEDCRREEPPNISLTQLKKHQGRSGSRDSWCSVLLGHKSGPDDPFVTHPGTM